MSKWAPCVLNPPKNKREGLVHYMFTTFGRPLEDKAKASRRNGYGLFYETSGGFQIRADFDPVEGASYLEVPSEICKLCEKVLLACDDAYEIGFYSGEAVGLRLGKSLLHRLAAGEVSTVEFDKTNSMYKEKRDRPLSMKWPG